MSEADEDRKIRVRLTIDVEVDYWKWLQHTTEFPTEPPPGYPEGSPWPPPGAREAALAEVGSGHDDVAEHATSALVCAEHLLETGATVQLVRTEQLPGPTSA